MMQPFRIQNPRALNTLGFSGEDIRSVNEIGIFLDSVETLGGGSSFSTMMHTLGRAQEMVDHYTALVRRLEAIGDAPPITP
jgi:hypothetical protein